MIKHGFMCIFLSDKKLNITKEYRLYIDKWRVKEAFSVIFSTLFTAHIYSGILLRNTVCNALPGRRHGELLDECHTNEIHR